MAGRTISVRRRSRMVRWWWVFVVVVVAAVAAGYLLLRDRHAQAPTTAPVTVEIDLAPYPITVTGPGSLTPIRSVALTPSVGGTVVSIASVGDRVTSGEVVAQLAPTDFQRAVDTAKLSLLQAQQSLASLQANQAKNAAGLASQITSARAAVDAAQRAYDTQNGNAALTQTLFTMGSASAVDLQAANDAASNARDALTNARTSLAALLSTRTLQGAADEQDLGKARIAVSQAELDLATAQQDLKSATLSAPFDGVVSAVGAAVGEPSGNAAALLTIVDDAKVQLGAQIDESDIGSVALEQAARVTFDALIGRTFDATVSGIAPTATLVSNIPVYYVTVDIDNPDHALRAGMTGQATIVTTVVPDTFQVPAKAVTTGSNGSFVQVEQLDGSFRPVHVAIVGTSGLNSVLTGNVKAGATVLVSGGTPGTGASSRDAPATPPGQGTPRRPGVVPFGGGGGGFRTPRRTTGRT